MGLCKCTHCPQQGNFVVGRYYSWVHPVRENQFWHEGRSVADEQGERYRFPIKEYASYFKEIEIPDFSMEIYIDRKRELLFVPCFRHEAGYSVKLDYFEQLPFPYKAEEAGKTFRTVWETYRNHPVVKAEEVERITPYYKIVTKGKGFRAFSGSRWMICVQFITSENEIIFEYWYRKKGGAFGRDTTDRHINRIIKLPTDNITLGTAILDIFAEAGVP